jgi:hypothetical protein
LVVTLTAQPVDVSSGSPTFTAQQSRQAFSAHIANGSSRTLGTVSGWSPGRTPSTLTATSTTWTVGQFACLIDPAFTTTQSIYEVSNDANLTGSVTAANATNPRKDILYVTVNDAGMGDGSGSRTPAVSYLAGTAASSPTAPATPARSFLIATITVPQSGGGSPTIALNNTFQTAAGGIVPVVNFAALPATPYDGMAAWTMDTDLLWTYTGSAWIVQSPRSTLYNGTPLAQSSPGPVGTQTPLVVAAVPYPSFHSVSWGVFLTQTVGTDVFDGYLTQAASLVQAGRFGGGPYTASGTYTVAVAANTAVTWQVVFARIAGTGTASCVADGHYNWLQVTVSPQ